MSDMNIVNLPVDFDKTHPSFVAAVRKLREDIENGIVLTEKPQWLPGPGLGTIYARASDPADGITDAAWAVSMEAYTPPKAMSFKDVLIRVEHLARHVSLSASVYVLVDDIMGEGALVDITEKDGVIYIEGKVL